MTSFGYRGSPASPLGRARPGAHSTASPSGGDGPRAGEGLGVRTLSERERHPQRTAALHAKQGDAIRC